MNLLEGRNGPKFFDSWESTAKNEREDLIRRRLDDYIRFAIDKVPAYRERLASYNLKSEYPLAHIEPLDSKIFREGLPPTGNHWIADSRPDFTVFQSGGTTGLPKSTLFSHEELEGLNLPNGRGFFALGLQPSDRVANLFAVGGLYMTFIHINRMLQQYGCMNFPFSNHTPVDFIHTVVKCFNVNAFAGITSVVLNALRGIHSAGAQGIQIEKVYYGGEHIYEADKNELREKLGVKLIAAPGYGTVDSWYIGYQCTHCPTGVFHAHDDQTYIEIVDEETRTHCRPGDVGMLYATAFPRKLTPVVRYKVGDRAKWLSEGCPCGRTTPLFQLLGRGDDVLRIGFDSVDYNFIQDRVVEIKGLLGTVQIEKQRSEGRDRLIVRVESDVDASHYLQLSEKLEKNILDVRPSLREFVANGTVWPLKIEIVPANTLSRNPRTGKLIRVIDAI